MTRIPCLFDNVRLKPSGLTFKHRTQRSLLIGLCTGLAIFSFSPAQAMPISSDISISGETEFDELFSFGGAGSFSTIEGGSTSTSTYGGSVVTGTDPMEADLTETGDGFGFDGIASANDEEFGIGIDTSIDVFNSSTTDSYEVVFGLDFNNSVNADGADAYASSELTLDIGGIESFFSDLMSDTLDDAVNGFFGDEIAGVPQGTFGASLAELDTGLLFTLALNPGETIDMLLRWTLEGGDYDDGLAEADLSAFLYVDSVTNTTQLPPPPPPSGVPEAGSLFLFSAGFLGLLLKRRRQVRA